MIKPMLLIKKLLEFLLRIDLTENRKESTLSEVTELIKQCRELKQEEINRLKLEIKEELKKENEK